MAMQLGERGASCHRGKLSLAIFETTPYLEPPNDVIRLDPMQISCTENEVSPLAVLQSCVPVAATFSLT